MFEIQLLFILIINVIFVANDTCIREQDCKQDMASNKLLSVDFEVFGRVQGVFFRKYTQQEAKKLRLTGWCMNTEKGTVQGVMQGEITNIEVMKRWLQATGSPQSRIERAEFKNASEIKKLNFSTFDIKR